MMERIQNSLTVVIIGRNEGDRLKRCIESVRAMEPWPGTVEIVYVDSGSQDGSPEAAAKSGVRVLQVGREHPTAALGRNAGWRAAEGAEYILFLDGDTVLAPGFARTALATMEGNPEAAAVWGHRREIRPEQSIYTRVLDLDWIYPLGEFPFCGGDVLMRRAALEAAGGYDPEMIAGEEPELCRRMRALDWRILHVDCAMTGHDLAMTRFGQYWRRSERTGYALAKVAERFRKTDDPMWLAGSRHNLRQGIFWMGTPLAAAALAVGLRSWWPVGLWLAGFGAAAARSAWKARWKSRSMWTLMLYGVHSHVQQIPILMGQMRFYSDARRGRRRELMEYR
jgi:cellulose synthase/poly-beta-1,6-N-acetylglucosamine synthase-like glycosyltransferase